MLAVIEATRAGYEEAILLTDDGYVADGSGENIFVVKDEVISTPDLSASILPGITRQTVIEIAQTLGYAVHERHLIRSDLYVADELFMCGTAAEVTPVRSVDDHEIGDPGPGDEGDPGRLLRRRPRPRRTLLAVAGVRGEDAGRAGILSSAERSRSPRPGSTGARRSSSSRRCARGSSRSGRWSTGSRPRSQSASARRTSPPSRAGPPACTSAMRLAGVGPGDEVVTTPFSFVASANCALYEGATPVFADIDPRTLNLDPAAVEAAITPRTKAILAGAHLRLPGRARRRSRQSPSAHGLAIVEDACEALGSEYRGRPVGSSGHPTVFAFYPNKQMTTGEGGAVAVASEEEWALLKSLSNQGRSDSGEWLTHSRLGYNYRLDDLSAALGLAQLERLDEILAAPRRRRRPLRGAARRRRAGRGAAARRRRPPPLVVRLRRQARARDRPRTA